MGQRKSPELPEKFNIFNENFPKRNDNFEELDTDSLSGWPFKEDITKQQKKEDIDEDNNQKEIVDGSDQPLLFESRRSSSEIVSVEDHKYDYESSDEIKYESAKTMDNMNECLEKRSEVSPEMHPENLEAQSFAADELNENELDIIEPVITSSSENVSGHLTESPEDVRIDKPHIVKEINESPKDNEFDEQYSSSQKHKILISPNEQQEDLANTENNVINMVEFDNSENKEPRKHKFGGIKQIMKKMSLRNKVASSKFSPRLSTDDISESSNLQKSKKSKKFRFSSRRSLSSSDLTEPKQLRKDEISSDSKERKSRTRQFSNFFKRTKKSPISKSEVSDDEVSNIDIISNPTLLHHFEKYINEYIKKDDLYRESTKDISFLKEFSNFKTITSKKNRILSAELMSSEYLYENAPQKISVSQKYVRKIRRHIDDAPNELFDNIINEILERQQKNFKNFLESKHYQKFLNE